MGAEGEHIHRNANVSDMIAGNRPTSREGDGERERDGEREGTCWGEGFSELWDIDTAQFAQKLLCWQTVAIDRDQEQINLSGEACGDGRKCVNIKKAQCPWS